jgi:hypothetical protein
MDIDTTDNNSQIFSNIHKINFFIFFQRDYSIHNKFTFLKDTLKNIFNTDEMNEQFIGYFNKIQKTYHAFSRLSFIYRYKKAKVMVDTDLIMNEIGENNKFVYCLFQNNCKYLFKIHELIKIIHNSIANSFHFFSTPIPIKNPYTNIILNKSTLYNIYFFIQNKTVLRPELFYYFFKTNFNLYKFNSEYKHLLRDFAIKNYLNNHSKDVIYNDIEYMINEYNEVIKYTTHEIIIDNTFPKDLLIEIMMPYLLLFIKSHFSFMYADRLFAKKLLKQKLYEFNKFNPQFGRKIYKKIVNITIGDNKLVNKTENFQYNTMHIAFNESENIKDRNEFMQSHETKLIEEVNDDDDNNGDDNNGDDNNGDDNNGDDNNGDDNNGDDNNGDDNENDWW